MPKIAIIVTNYSNEKEVCDYANVICKQTIVDQIIFVVVDNKESQNKTIDIKNYLNEKNLNHLYVNPEKNLGYLNGVLYGYNELLKQFSINVDWIVVSNTDIEIPDNTFFEKFINKKYSEEVGCIAPSVFSPKNQSYDNPHYKDRCSINKINRLILIHNSPLLAYLYLRLANIKAKFLNNKKENSQYVYSAHGSFFILSDDFLKRIYQEPFGALMYSEEAYIAEKLMQNNYRCYYDSNFQVIHNENSVTGLLKMKQRSEYISTSLKFIRNNFYLS